MEINGFSESQLISLLRLAIDLAGDGGCSPWTDIEEKTMKAYFLKLKIFWKNFFAMLTF